MDILCPCGSPDWTRACLPGARWECAECGEFAYGETLDNLLEWEYDRSLPDMTGYAEC